MPDPVADFVDRRGLIFRAGSYPDRDFAVTPEELTAAAAAFTEPVPNDLSHTPTVLDGQLGHLTAVEARGGELHGTVRLPRWLDGLLADGQRKVSLLWDRETKRIKRLSIVPNPRIADAALFAAFSAAGGCLGAGGGCTCSACDPDDPGEEEPVSWLKALRDAITGNPNLSEDEVLEMVAEGIEGEGDGGGAPAPAAPAAPATAPAFSATPEYRAMLDRLEKAEGRAAKAEGQAETERAARVTSEAAAFAADEVRSGRSLPAERANLVTNYLQAAEDDHRSGGEVAFSSGGKDVKGTRVAALRAREAARQPHRLTTEFLAVRADHGDEPDPDAAFSLDNGGDGDDDAAARKINDAWAERRGLRRRGPASA